MANWYGACRTNYVQVKDVDAVIKAAAPFALELIRDEAGRVGFLSTDEYGGWPSSTYAEDDEDCLNEIEFDFGFIVPHLVEREVLVVVCSGAEKLRYVTGDALAYAWDGRVTRVDLTDIYKKVKDEFGVTTTLAEY